MIPLLAAFGVQQFMGARQAEADAQRARQQASARILQSSASRLGAPTYNVDAARTEASLQQQRQSRQRQNLSNVVGFMSKAGAFTGGAAIPGDVDPLEQDYLNNPRHY